MTEILQMIVGGVVILVGFAAALSYPRVRNKLSGVSRRVLQWSEAG